MCFLDLQMIEQADRVFHQIDAVGIGIVWLIALSVASAIQGDDLKSIRKRFK